jgi:tripartite-type tricarboxylate transporter receptor subunit TctC
VLAPARTPPEVIARLNAAFNAALDTAPVVEAFTNLGIEKLDGTPAELAALVREEQEGWGPVIQRGGISLQ